ncbi:rhomboid family intramembrane serine protease [Candidatus Daviesbacteria bacterium]|nr:rhomboid family intramembrane serine protease [Candidatus Daviesbacteria bacterium]
MIPLKDAYSLSRFPFWVVIIILINTYIFYLELAASSPEFFILQYSLIPAQVNLADVLTLLPFISSQFLHAGFLHIISNMLFLWVFGNNVEVGLGFLLFPIFYLLSGIVAALTQYLITPESSIPMLGASGAVAGVLGAYFALFPKHKIKTLLIIFVFVTIVDIPAYFLLFYWFITQFFSGVASINSVDGGIAFLPHIGGFLFGWLFAIPLLSKVQTLKLRLLS